MAFSSLAINTAAKALNLANTAPSSAISKAGRKRLLNQATGLQLAANSSTNRMTTKKQLAALRFNAAPSVRGFGLGKNRARLKLNSYNPSKGRKPTIDFKQFSKTRALGKRDSLIHIRKTLRPKAFRLNFFV